MEDKGADGLRTSPLLMYGRYVEADIIPVLGWVRLRELRPVHVDQLMRQLRQAGRGDTARKRIHATLRSALTTAQQAGLIYTSAAAEVRIAAARPPKCTLRSPTN